MRYLILLICTTFVFSQIDVYHSESILNMDKKVIENISNLLTEMDEEDDFDIETVKELFTEDGFAQFVILYENHRFIPNRGEYTIEASDFLISGDDLIISGIDLKNTLSDVTDPSEIDNILVKTINFIFDKPSKRIRQMVIVDPKQDYKISLESGESITSDQIVADIKRFIEVFRTFYEERNIGEIEKMYSDDAIIITGKRVNKVSENKTVIQARDGKKYELSRQNKQDYIAKLARVFKYIKSSKGYLKLDFKDIQIKQHGKYDQVFGVSLEQHWQTKTYSDIGDLFLIIDYTYPDTPQVRIRTWMPTGAQKFALYDFKLN